MNTPILFCLYKRQDTPLQIIEVLREIRPPLLFVTADGGSTPEDQIECKAVRAAVLDHIDWPCQVETDFSEQHLGARQRIASAITWVFEKVETAIILEDDCLPHPTFFRFCEELLARYADDPRVMMIAGTNPMLTWTNGSDPASYHFSRWGINWGWATWRRAWACFDDHLTVLENPVVMAQIQEDIADELMFANRLHFWHKVKASEIDAWDYQWSLACLAQRSIAAIPSVNLVRNIGFGADATHTTNRLTLGASMPEAALSFPLTHPLHVAPDSVYDKGYIRWKNGTPDPEIVIRYAQHALAEQQLARALLLVKALVQQQPHIAGDPVVVELQTLALNQLRTRQHGE